jgi:NAD(P)-dependent dehydrogenase (short-subunit alcohol dehydrogenase family)
MDRSLFGLEGRNALVLGGGQGMGESTSLLLARVGANVAVLDVEPERAERVAAEVRQKGSKALALQADALDTAALRDAIARADRELGGLDAMASIIGMAAWAPSLEMSEETWDLDHRRNLRYFFFAAQTAARCMIARGGGAIVGVASMDGIRSAHGHASYGAAKAGLINLSKTLASELSEHRIRINIVAPGTIATPRIPLGTPEHEKPMWTGTPMQRRGTTDEIGKAILFFLSDLSSFVTGQTLAVDGGYLASHVIDYAKFTRAMRPGGTMGQARSK